ncbi:MAG: chalcone isomerase family protein [Gammaproteobacteria bacterium]|nr:chalcone isomerase family protein [Gammaproteobacteria bacterium]
MIKKAFVITVLLLTIAKTSFAGTNETFAEVLGVSLPYKIDLEKTKEQLYLNGHAVVSMWGSEAYVAALYTSHVEKRAEMLLMNDEPIAMLFYFVQDDITAEMISETFTEAILVNNGGWNNKKLDRTRIIELKEAFKKTLNAGDELAFYYSPQNGVLMQINGHDIAYWPHAKSFFNMLLRMWVGPYPPSRSFKRAILNFPIKKSQ